MIGRNENSRVFRANNDSGSDTPRPISREERERQLLASIGGYKMIRLAVEFHRPEPRSYVRPSHRVNGPSLDGGGI